MSEKFKITEEEINQTLMHSPLALPDSPSHSGLGARQIKKYFYDFIRQLSQRINTHLGDVGTEVDRLGTDLGATDSVAKEAKSLAESAHKLASGKSKVHIVADTAVLFYQLLNSELSVNKGDFILVLAKGSPDFIVYSNEGEMLPGDKTVVTFDNYASVAPVVGGVYMTAVNHIILVGIESGIDTSVFATKAELDEAIANMDEHVLRDITSAVESANNYTDAAIQNAILDSWEVAV